MDNLFHYIRETDITKICDNLKDILERQEAENKELRKKLEALEDEKWKDNELQKMQTAIQEIEEEYDYGFGITKAEYKKIEEWKSQHIEKYHGKGSTGGTIGGTYDYVFTPTSIGTFGYCKCGICKEKFQFQEP